MKSVMTVNSLLKLHVNATTKYVQLIMSMIFTAIMIIAPKVFTKRTKMRTHVPIREDLIEINTHVNVEHLSAQTHNTVW